MCKSAVTETRSVFNLIKLLNYLRTEKSSAQLAVTQKVKLKSVKDIRSHWRAWNDQFKLIKPSSVIKCKSVRFCLNFGGFSMKRNRFGRCASPHCVINQKVSDLVRREPWRGFLWYFVDESRVKTGYPRPKLSRRSRVYRNYTLEARLRARDSLNSMKLAELHKRPNQSTNAWFTGKFKFLFCRIANACAINSLLLECTLWTNWNLHTSPRVAATSLMAASLIFLQIVYEMSLSSGVLNLFCWSIKSANCMFAYYEVDVFIAG